MGLIKDLGKGPTCLDTAPFIYFIEEHKEYSPVIESVFRALDQGKLQAVTSALTLAEVLVVPFRNNNPGLAQKYEDFLSRGRGLHLVDIDRFILREAAYLRAVSSVKMPDAIQIATALRCGCSTLVTNDRKLPRIPGLKVLQLGDYA